jgi:adenine-specific DNA-methyltransferase
MNYIGSKYSLLQEIGAILDKNQVPPDRIAVDLFAGTGAVAQFLKQRGYCVYANDWQTYSYYTNLAFIKYNDLPSFERLLSDTLWERRIRSVKPVYPVVAYSISQRRQLNTEEPCAQVLTYLNQMPGKRGLFYETYCQGGTEGRQYYAHENGLRIQSIRDQIQEWYKQKLISERENAWLVACLIEAADRVANTASVYGAHLKHIKRTAQKPLVLVALHPVDSLFDEEQHRVFCEDGEQLLRKLNQQECRLVYIDPPYNHRQYSANYHILETIACWDIDTFVPRGVTGLRPSLLQRSDFCIRSSVAETFHRLFSLVRAEYLLFSYNNEGLLSEEQLRALFEEFCIDITFEKLPFKRFRADVDRDNRIYTAHSTYEFLVLGRVRQAANSGYLHRCLGNSANSTPR